MLPVKSSQHLCPSKFWSFSKFNSIEDLKGIALERGQKQ